MQQKKRSTEPKPYALRSISKIKRRVEKKKKKIKAKADQSIYRCVCVMCIIILFLTTHTVDDAFRNDGQTSC